MRAVERSETLATTTTSPPSSSEPNPIPTTGPNGGEPLNARALVEALASDDLEGRDNLTPGSTDAQALIVEQLSQFAQPALADGYLQPFTLGSNILGVIPGGDLADEYVVIGAHYDHIGFNCVSADPVDQICNGATDNATGVATVLSIGRAIAAQGTPRRSVLIALWDAEEDGLVGSAAYVANPAVPIGQTVVYLNFDIQGANLLPSMANFTLTIGAETGGDGLVQATARAVDGSTLEHVVLSSFLFEGRSDHANFAQAGVPSMMLSDATGGCYHTAQDEADIVDYAKLDQQIAVGTALVRELATTDTPPRSDLSAPNIVFADAVALLAFVEPAEADLSLLNPPAAAQVQQFIDDLRTIVDAGADAFDSVAIATVMDGVDQLVESLTEAACQSFVS